MDVPHPANPIDLRVPRRDLASPTVAMTHNPSHDQTHKAADQPTLNRSRCATAQNTPILRRESAPPW